ncbi:arginase-1-like isoform X1 [Dermacentor variabilis]|uniref:arginase-1-like isoform X1 n=1 Tax=Dermacentor variabilis TaxID=34621 RepID=UPI003F5B07CA
MLHRAVLRHGLQQIVPAFPPFPQEPLLSRAVSCNGSSILGNSCGILVLSLRKMLLQLLVLSTAGPACPEGRPLNEERIDNDSPSASNGTSRRQEIAVLGVPIHQGQRKLGVEKGPQFLRDAGLLDKLRDLGHKVEDLGDVRVQGEPNITDCGAIDSDVVGQTNKNVRDAVEKVLRSGRVSLNLGGDHTMSIGTVSGHASSTDSEVALIWVDAHGDINTPSSSTSGNIHGMPLSFLVHELAPYVVKPKGLEWVQPCVRKDNLVYIGLRDVDPYERYFMDHLGIRTYDMGDIDRLGIQAVVQRTLQEINPAGDKSLHISFDIDSIDKLVAPSTGTPVLGGLTLREALVIAEEVSKSGQLRVLDLAEVNPLLGNEQDAGHTVDCGVKLVDAFFGSPRGGHQPLELDANIIDPKCLSCQ